MHGTERLQYISKLLKRIDDHPGSCNPDEGIYHDKMINKFEQDGDLPDRDIAHLERILRRLDADFDPDSYEF